MGSFSCLVFIGCLATLDCNGFPSHWAFLYLINVLSEYCSVDRSFVIALTATPSELIFGNGLAHFFFEVFCDALIAAAVGAPLLPTGRIRSPDPASILFCFALMLCQRPFFPFGLFIVIWVVLFDIGDSRLGAFVFLLMSRIHGQATIKLSTKAARITSRHIAGGIQNGANTQSHDHAIKLVSFRTINAKPSKE